jgi:hypothetical protein
MKGRPAGFQVLDVAGRRLGEAAIDKSVERTPRMLSEFLIRPDAREGAGR